MGSSSLAFAPRGWPSAVRPPLAPGWEHTAVRWLLDHCPPEARGYGGLRREPVVLAMWARLHYQAQLRSMQVALSQTRADLKDFASESVVDRAIILWQREEARITRVAREIAIVEQALRGRTFRPRL
jgi:hypothetical protein